MAKEKKLTQTHQTKWNHSGSKVKQTNHGYPDIGIMSQRRESSFFLRRKMVNIEGLIEEMVRNRGSLGTERELLGQVGGKRIPGRAHSMYRDPSVTTDDKFTK